MKKLIMIMTCIIICFVACSDRLDQDPIGLLTEDQIGAAPTVAFLQSSVLTSYDPLKSTKNAIIPGWRWDLGVVWRNDIILQDMASGDMDKKWSPDGDQAWMDDVIDFSFTSQNQAFNGIWVYDYIGINSVNLAIGFLTNNDVVSESGISDSAKKQLLSEALFLRAFYYFDLVNNFGDVPLITAKAETIEETLALAVRVPAIEIWAQINKDLSDAKSLAVNAKFPVPIDPWRVSKGAIIAMQAKAALFDQDWSAVLSLISELDALGNYSLNAEYFDSFDASIEFTDDEVIFAYDHRLNENPNNKNGLRDPTASWGFFAPTTDFIAAFEANDPRLLYTTTADINNIGSPKIVGSKIDPVDDGNKIYIRYADVLLWKAEALNETGDSAGAVNIINQIRYRARTSVAVDGSVVPSGTLPDRATSGTAAQVKSWLMSERRVELGFESQRFNDLKRWGVAKSVLTALGRNFQDHHNLYPIPQLDIDKSGGTISQNPGY